jgi:hypothetical protein
MTSNSSELLRFWTPCISKKNDYVAKLEGVTGEPNVSAYASVLAKKQYVSL